MIAEVFDFFSLNLANNFFRLDIKIALDICIYASGLIHWANLRKDRILQFVSQHDLHKNFSA